MNAKTLGFLALRNKRFGKGLMGSLYGVRNAYMRKSDHVWSYSTVFGALLAHLALRTVKVNCRPVRIYAVRAGEKLRAYQE